MGGMRVFVTVGTDHHIFDRLLDWIGAWAAERPHATVVVQHGDGPLPAACQGYSFLTIEEMREQIRAADVVICSSGPGAVMDARDLGHLPIAVPRLSRYAEAVDDHQVAFAQLLDERGVARCAADAVQLFAVLDEAERHPKRFRVDTIGRPQPAGIAGVAQLVDDLVWRR
jgi:UDP-N-acetylglucosamine transferase subunit ALG13